MALPLPLLAFSFSLSLFASPASAQQQFLDLLDIPVEQRQSVQSSQSSASFAADAQRYVPDYAYLPAYCTDSDKLCAGYTQQCSSYMVYEVCLRTCGMCHLLDSFLAASASASSSSSSYVVNVQQQNK